MISHHPSDDILGRYAAGSVEAGAALVIGSHADACAVCRSEIALLNGLGGSLLAGSEPDTLSEGALEHMLERLENEAAQPARTPPRPPDFLAQFDIPNRVRGYDIGHRRWLTPGIWFAPVAATWRPDTRTYFLYGAKGKLIPRHAHPGKELTLVLKGAYVDDSGQFACGDFAEADQSVSHSQRVTDAGECLCLVHSDEPMRPDGLIARLIQGLTGRRY